MTAAAIATLGIAPVQAEPRATPTRVRLEFLRGPGAEDCPDEPFLREQTIRKMAGVDPFDAAAPLTLTASIERRRGELTAALFLRDRSGRGLWADGFSASADCEVLVSAIALSIAVLLDGDELPAIPGATPDLPAAPGAPPAQPQPTDQAMVPEQPCSPDRPCPLQPVPAPVSSSQKTSPPRKTPPGNSAPPAPSERFRWTAGLDVVTGLGLTPGVSLGSAMSVGARWPAWSAALEVRGLSSLSGKVEAVAVSVSTVTADVVLCLNRRTLFACGLAEIGVLRAAPTIPFDAASWLNLRAGLGVRAGIALPLAENLSVRAYAEVVHPVIGIAILRHPGALVRERPVWSAPALAAALGIGLQANL
ncbi:MULTISPECIES: hypothetical protein [Sorangium]|uniref:Uncharacterized protein n=1 Tax=Sorangium cellulosum TaxID=56 RepID=A0A4P2QG55_SORCE|nr:MULTISPECIES: hypothetical protein [Sorangium]AUX28458.1 hypothetical protein SOCE836_005280 [Sorangium cellulosum]WCQ87850.1 hypothetical protein NQZ70_00514 [Sorangium sp. Soce836]